ncbi:MAG: acyl carrier protein [Actinomycetota bacterium]|nr:acyl carrier protein [Actinomycetota bacterium]
MDRDIVLEKVRSHLAEELGVDSGSITDDTHFRDDLEADSLDLYELVMELEDTYGVKMSEQEAEEIVTVGQAVDFVAERAQTPS